jgi:hypothetical protein
MRLLAVVFMLLIVSESVFAQTETPYPTATPTEAPTLTPTPNVFHWLTLAEGTEQEQNAQIQYTVSAGQIGIFAVLVMLLLIEVTRFVIERWR